MSRIKQKKWDKIYANNSHGSYPPAMVLKMQTHLLPRKGNALDLACGLGRNAIYLCRHGLTTFAWDISAEAINRIDKYAAAERLMINTEIRDVSKIPPEPNRFDVIVVSHFLDRSLMTHLVNALKDDGLLFYQTFTLDKVTDTGPTNPNYLLKKGELLRIFKDQELLFYCDNSDAGDTELGIRNEAMIVIRKNGAPTSGRNLPKMATSP